MLHELTSLTLHVFNLSCESTLIYPLINGPKLSGNPSSWNAHEIFSKLGLMLYCTHAWFQDVSGLVGSWKFVAFSCSLFISQFALQYHLYAWKAKLVSSTLLEHFLTSHLSANSLCSLNQCSQNHCSLNLCSLNIVQWRTQWRAF